MKRMQQLGLSGASGASAEQDEGAAAAAQVMLRQSAEHFEKCTELLEKNSFKSAAPLTCPVMDVRPEAFSEPFEDAILASLTTGELRETTFPGDHWTMVAIKSTRAGYPQRMRLGNTNLGRIES